MEPFLVAVSTISALGASFSMVKAYRPPEHLLTDLVVRDEDCPLVAEPVNRVGGDKPCS